jgi:hypothetical protein
MDMLNIVSISTTYQNVWWYFGHISAWRSDTLNAVKGLNVLHMHKIIEINNLKG